MSASLELTMKVAYTLNGTPTEVIKEKRGFGFSSGHRG